MTTLITPGNDEYLDVTISGDVVLAAQAVSIGWGRDADSITWLPATWTGDAGTTRAARTNDTVEALNLPQRLALSIFYRVVDTTETIVQRAGVIYVGG